MTDGTPLELGKRQRQIYEAVLKIGQGSVSDILAELESPPSYSAVRAMLGILVDKGYLKIREEGRKYVYHASLSKQKTQKTALRRMLDTFFGGSPTAAVAALLELESHGISETEAKKLRQLINEAKRPESGS
jgi:BlaI family penicillinase repressor